MKNIFFIFFIFSWSWIIAQDSDCTFGLVLHSTEAVVGESVVIDVTTRQFNDIIGMQYNHQWNTEYLRFEEVIYNEDSPVSATNFNLSTADTDLGKLKFLWVESVLQGIDLPDNSTLYSLRFTYLLAGETQVQTNGEELSVEIIHNASEIINNFYFIHAVVTDNQDAFPIMDSACIIEEDCMESASGSINIAIQNPELMSFQWQSTPGFESLSQNISSLTSNTYTLTATHQNGSSLYGDFYLHEAGGLSVQLTVDNDECAGMPDGAITTTIENGSGDYAYLWSNGETTASLNNLGSGTYGLTVTDNMLGCVGIVEAQLEANSSFWVSDQSVTASCSDVANGRIDLSVDGPATYAPFTYLWSNGSTDEDIDNLSPGPYVVTITAANGCSMEYTVMLPFFEGNPDIQPDITHTGCQGGTGSISLTFDTDDYGVLWSTGATTTEITELAAGDYAVTLSDLHADCSYLYYYTIYEEELAAAYALSCDDGNAALTAVLWLDFDAPYTFEWSTGDVTTADMVSTIFIDNDGLYAVTITGVSGCSVVIEDMNVNCADNNIDLYVSPEQISVANGASFCLDIKAERMQSQVGFQFSMEWDESLLSYTGVNNFGPPAMDYGSFGTLLTDDGLLVVSWADILEINLPPNTTLFSVCFDVLTDQPATTVFRIQDFPTPIEFVNSNLIIQTVSTQDAIISLNGGDNDGILRLIMADKTAQQHELLCVPVNSVGFSDISGIQFCLEWDPQGLEFNSVQNINLPNTALMGNFGTIEEAQSDGKLRFLWVDSDMGGEVIPTGTPLFEVCYVVLAETGSYPINFVQETMPTQAIKSNFEEVETILTGGMVEVQESASDEPVRLAIASSAVDIGESICLPVYVINMEQILAMQFSIIWDETLISLDEIVPSANLPNLNGSHFFPSPSGGVLSFSWYSPDLIPITLAENTPLFDLCFTAGQAEGVSAVSFSNQPTPFEFVQENDELLSFVPGNGHIIITPDGLVWPGDTDSNAAVDHFDLLNIGIAFDAEGPARDNASINWLAQYAAPWENQTPLSIINYRHIDTDGNGVINETDVQVLEQNWGETTDEFNTSPEDFRLLEQGSIPFYVGPDTVGAGVQVYLPILLGTEEATVTDVYGVAFSIYYDPLLVRPGSAEVLFDGWIGSEEDGLLSVYRDQHSWGRIDIALVRTNKQNASGNGQIATFGVIMEDVIFRDFIDVELALRIDNVRLINVSEDILPTSPLETIILVEGVTSTGEAPALRALQLHPNPTIGTFTINHPNIDIQNIYIFDAQGQLKSSLDPDEIDVSYLASGVYWLQFQTNKGVAYRKLIKL